jgi:hypothetical protein
VVEAATLSLIEQLFAMDEINLQDHYDSFETCYGEGIKIIICTNCMRNNSCLNTFAEDPAGNACETAYLLYKCAMDYFDIPTFIAQIDSNTTAVCFSSAR